MNFSISELVVILVIALLVIKPDQMPEVAFTLGRFIQSMRRLVDKMKGEMNGLLDSVENEHDTKREQQ